MPHPETVLNQGGLYSDDLSQRILVLDPTLHQLNSELVNQCLEYVEASEECKKSSVALMTSLKNLGECVAVEKQKVLRLNNRLLQIYSNSVKTQSVMNEQINERKVILDRLTHQSKSLLKMEKDLEATVKAL